MVFHLQKVKRAMTRRERTDLNCPRCGLIVTASEHRAGHHVCARRADPDHARAMRDQAKAEAKAAGRPKETT
jgi:hypothetical protein